MTRMMKTKKTLLRISKRKRVMYGVICSTIVLIIWYLTGDLRIIWKLNIKLEGDGWSPDGRDNITGWPTNIVPDIVHYILFEYHRITYSNMLSLLSVVHIHQPENIYIHCDCSEIDGDDENWKRVLHAVNITNKSTIQIIQIEKPTEINGMKIRKDNANFHASDITRYRTLKQYGGIYLDNDVFVCQPLHHFRKFEFTLNWDENQYMGSQVLIGHKNARFLRLVLQTYQAYDTDRWYFNAGELPTRAILDKYPYIIHRIKRQFGVDAPECCKYFYKEYHSNWRTAYYTFHMVMRGNAIYHKNWCLGAKDHPLKHTVFNDDVLRTMNNTFAEMARHVLFT